MKKSIFLAALLLVGAGCFAQKSNVSKARNLADAETPDFAGAKAAINLALENEETKNLPNTWYVAGFIGYKEFDAANLNRQLGRAIDNAKLGADVLSSVNYWNKAYELTKTPLSYDKKGNPKYDTRTPKVILPKLVEYYTTQALMSGSFEVYDKQDPSLAYDMCIAHVNIPHMQIFKDFPAEAAKLVMDSTYYTYLYYAGRFAYEAKRYDEAIATLERMNTEHANQNALRKEIVFANEYIYQIYLEKGDTVKALESIKKSIELFPEEAWFMQNLINHYINVGQEAMAIEYLDLAINREPNVAQYYNSKGSILARIGRFDESFEVFKKALELDPNNPIILATLGYAYIDLGNKINDDAAYLSNKAFQKEKAKADAAFYQAMLNFEKAYELEPTNEEYKRNLRSMCYRLGMMDKYNALGD
jgi:tetratricopeptide (TPR) repeat protein